MLPAIMGPFPYEHDGKFAKVWPSFWVDIWLWTPSLLALYFPLYLRRRASAKLVSR